MSMINAHLSCTWNLVLTFFHFFPHSNWNQNEIPAQKCSSYADIYMYVCSPSSLPSLFLTSCDLLCERTCQSLQWKLILAPHHSITFNVRVCLSQLLITCVSGLILESFCNLTKHETLTHLQPSYFRLQGVIEFEVEHYVLFDNFWWDAILCSCPISFKKGIQWNLVIMRTLGPWKLPCYNRFFIITG